MEPQTIHVEARDYTIYSEAHPEDMAGALRYIFAAYPDEPLFVIRGRDAFAVPVLDAYTDACFNCGANGQGRRAAEHRERFIVWQTKNAKLTHIPDPLPEDRKFQIS